jgi:DNA-binding response OmpR family regulator
MGEVPADAAFRIGVCLIDNDGRTRRDALLGLKLMGFGVDGFPSAETFYRGLLGKRWDIVLIRDDLPGENGYCVAAHLRDTGQAERTGLVLLSDRGSIENRLRALASADAFLVNPVELLELAATITSLARRVRASAAREKPGISGRSELIEDGWVLATPSGIRLTLTANERAFLRELFATRGRPVSREALAVALGGNPWDFDFHRLDTLVGRLRKKAADRGTTLSLRAVRGVGYLFD